MTNKKKEPSQQNPCYLNNIYHNKLPPVRSSETSGILTPLNVQAAVQRRKQSNPNGHQLYIYPRKPEAKVNGWWKHCIPCTSNSKIKMVFAFLIYYFHSIFVQDLNWVIFFFQVFLVGKKSFHCRCC